MRINIFSDSGSLNHFLVDEVIDFVVIDEHDSAVFSRTHRLRLIVLKVGRIRWFSKQSISNKLTSLNIMEIIPAVVPTNRTSLLAPMEAFLQSRWCSFACACVLP